MRYISLFSGVEAATVAWHGIGWDPVVFAEFDEFPSMVLKHHYPDVKNVGDVMKHEWKQYEGEADVIVGGSPCQSFSIAGQRLGMDDPRGNLALHYLRIVREVKPSWFVFENVPGLLSSNGGEDLAIFLGEVAKCGYGFAYRILDAQHFGVPQRRRRIFIVGCADGDWRSAASVLFERQGVCGDSQAGGEEKEKPPFFFGGSAESTSEEGMTTIPIHAKTVSHSGGGDRSKNGKEPNNGVQNGFGVGKETDPMNTLDTSCNHAVFQEQKVMFENHPTDSRISESKEISPTVRARYGTGGGNVPLVKHAIPIHDKATRFKGGGEGRKDDGASNFLGVGDETDPMYALTTGDHHMVFDTASVVRRLTPIECERLQGFPDNYTQIPWKGKEAKDCPDGPRYKAMGNSMAVPVMEWIGMRIQAVDSIRRTVQREESKTSRQMQLW